MTTITLRDYQDEAVVLCHEHLLRGSYKDRPIVVAPTGGGKSIYIAHLTDLLKEGVLVIQPSKELLEQNYAKFKMYGGHASIYSASMGVKEVGKVTFATIGSIKTKAQLFSHIKYVLIDECHLVPPFLGSMFMTFFKELEQFAQFKVLGLTATPFRLKTYASMTGETYSQLNLLNREYPRFFNKFIHITQIKKLVEEKYLVPIKYIPLVWDSHQLVVNTTGAEFTEDSIDRELKRQMVHERIPGVVKQAREKGRNFQLVFVKNVSDAQDLASKVPESAYVCALTKKKERAQIINDFRSGKIKTIFNVGVLTIGFDFPALDTIIIARPTLSLALFMQMVGRGIRPFEGKTNCVVVDMVGNISRFSKIEDVEFTTDHRGSWVMKAGDKILSGVPISRD